MKPTQEYGSELNAVTIAARKAREAQVPWCGQGADLKTRAFEKAVALTA